MYNFDPYNVFLAIATNILMLLKAGFVVKGHIKEASIVLGNGSRKSQKWVKIQQVPLFLEHNLCWMVKLLFHTSDKLP